MIHYKITTYKDGKVLNQWGCDHPFDMQQDVKECIDLIVYQKIDKFEVREFKPKG